MGRSSQNETNAAREHDRGDWLKRDVAPGVYIASDGMLTADCLDSAIAYLRELGELGLEGC